VSQTPPSANPWRYCAKNHRLWRNPEDLGNGYWLVEQCAGPKASVIDMLVVRYDGTRTVPWAHIGAVTRPRYGRVNMELALNDKGYRTWKLMTPEDEFPQLVQEMIRLIKEYG
jgi:hypothetical protein